MLLGNKKGQPHWLSRPIRQIVPNCFKQGCPFLGAILLIVN